MPGFATSGWHVLGRIGFPGWTGLVRRKGFIGPRALWVLGVAGCVPLFMTLARVAALPGIHVPDLIGGDALRALGNALNTSLTLQWVPPDHRWAILYILLLPTCALLIALARLTFGLRVLGFRSILIAVGFHEIGILPSLGLMAVVMGIVFAIRPSMRRIQLPFYARISVILCIAAIIMVAGLFLGPWLRSDALWSFAFFPVIILAMLAEGIASTLARDDARTAAWRAGWTVALAMLIAVVCWIPAVREVALQCPELMLTQLVAIVFISEFFDFRLFEKWPARAPPGRDAPASRVPGQLKVAVVQNRWNMSVIGRLGVASSRRTQSAHVVVDALREQGCTARIFEGDIALLRELQEFLPADPLTGAPGGLVLNLATGVQGRGRYCHLPAVLEMAGVAYTGPDPVAQARVVDRYTLMMLLRQAGVATPTTKLLPGDSYDPGELRFPLVVRPRYESDEGSVVVSERRLLARAVQRIARVYSQDVLLESLESGPEIRVAMLGNDTIECLPLLQVDASGNGHICPAPVEDAVADRIRQCATRAYSAAGCRDYARIDIRLAADGQPQVIGIHSIGIFARRGSFAQAAQKGGYDFAELMRRVVEVAWRRYELAVPRTPVDSPRPIEPLREAQAAVT